MITTSSDQSSSRCADLFLLDATSTFTTRADRHSHKWIVAGGMTSEQPGSGGSLSPILHLLVEDDSLEEGEHAVLVASSDWMRSSATCRNCSASTRVPGGEVRRSSSGSRGASLATGCSEMAQASSNISRGSAAGTPRGGRRQLLLNGGHAASDEHQRRAAGAPAALT